MAKKPETIGFYRRPGNRQAKEWEGRLRRWLNLHAPQIKVTSRNPAMLLVLGGDGTILSAARKHSVRNQLICGFNLGTVGFLASVRAEKNFLLALKAIVDGRYSAIRRTMLSVSVTRNGRNVVDTAVLNEACVINPLGMVEVDISIDRNRIQSIRGTGVMAATPTGSTGYNLSAHGPIVDPSLECTIITELLDHNVPTPSIVVPSGKPVTFEIKSFRHRGLLTMPDTNRAADVLLVCDGQVVTPLDEGDRITVLNSATGITTVEVGSNYFYKSLHEKFSIE
jgi:NAD+ kinase